MKIRPLYIFIVFCLFHSALKAQGSLVSAFPDGGTPGQRIKVLLTGQGTNLTTANYVSFGKDILVESIQPLNPEMLYVTIKILPSAKEGYRNIVVRTANTALNFANAFSVFNGGSNVQAILQISPQQKFNLNYLGRQYNNSPIFFNLNVFNDQIARPLTVIVEISGNKYGHIATYKNELEAKPGMSYQLTNRDFNLVLQSQRSGPFKKLLETGSFPADDYIYYVRIYDKDKKLFESEHSYQVLNPVSKPDLIAPGIEMRSNPTLSISKQPFFQWFAIGDHFDLYVYKVEKGQNSAEEISLNLPIYSVIGIKQSNFLYPASAYLLREDEIYAWQIVSHIEDGNQGTVLKSELYWFKVKNKNKPLLQVNRMFIEPKLGTAAKGDSLKFNAILLNENHQEIEGNPYWSVIPTDAGSINQSGKFFPSPKEKPAAVIATMGDFQDYALVNLHDSDIILGHEDWMPISPVPNSKIANGELLIVVKFDSTLKFSRNSIEVFIDDYLVTTNIKLFKNKLSVLYLLPLKAGKHQIEIRASSMSRGWLLPLIWTFEVEESHDVHQDYMGLQREKEYDKIIKGTFGFEINATNTNAENYLLQKPTLERNIYLDADFKAGDIHIPIKIFSTNRNALLPGMNTSDFYSFGIQRRNIKLRFGDMNPVFNPLVLDGIRITGIKLNLDIKRKSLTLLNGYINPGADGFRIANENEIGMQPQLLQPDFSYLIPGVYKRKISAMRLTFGNKVEGSSIGFNVIKVRDDLYSIANGYAPHDNLVIGMDESVTTIESKIQFNAGVFASFYTDDISKNAMTAEAVDSLFGFKLPFNPQNYQNFFIINETTLKNGKQSLAGYINTEFRSDKNTLLLEYKYVGGGFKSLANPYLYDDFRGFMIQDKLSLWKRKILLTTRYNLRISNLSESQVSFINYHLAQANVLFMPGEKLPQFNIYYNLNWHINNPSTNLLSTVNDQMNTLGINMNYSLTPNNFGNQNITFNYLQSDRINKVWSQNTVSFKNMNLILTENLDPYIFTVQYNKSLFSPFAKNLSTLYDIYNLNFQYHILKIKSSCGLGYSYIKYAATDISTASSRHNLHLNISGTYTKGLLMELEAGFAPFRSKEISNHNFYDNYVRLRCSYDLNFHQE